MAKLVRRKCPCLRPKIEEEVRVLDYRHSSLTDVPSDVFNFERTLEELYTDSNQIRDLPRELFYCHGLRKLSISDNEITSIPPAIASLDHLEELDFSKNGIIDVPDNVKCCKYLRIIDASVNPLGKLPEGFTQLQNLTHLYLNDTFLDYLPGSFGRLVKLKILELRENHLKTLPKSFGRLSELERLDIGHNEFTELPDVVGSLTKLLELWCDNNQITSLTHAIGALKQLMFLDASKNQLESLPGEIEGCTCLADLHLSTNQLQTLPNAIGNLSNLTTLKADDNQLTELPSILGGLTSLSELNISVNDLEELPVSIGLLRNLRTFYADENLLTFVPAELGSCSGITVLSLRSNRLTYIPDEIGRIPRLRVLNLSDNVLNHLPFTIVKLKELQALWLTENQTRPLIPLQSDYEAETGRKILTCYLLPQGHNSDNDENGAEGDSDSFHASIWDEERLQRQQIHFSFGDDEEDEGHLVRCPTPYPKEMREKARHMRNLAMRQSMGDGAKATNWTPQQVDPSHTVQQENNGSIHSGSGEGVLDVRVGEARISKPAQSPSLSETHRLYRYDKEKQIRDKARMQHRLSMPNIEDMSVTITGTPRSIKQGASTSVGSDSEDGRVTGRRKSTPNLFSFDGQVAEGKPKRMPSFTYEDLYQKQILHKHHHHGRRARRTRDYDSDTGYKSDRDSRSCHNRNSGDMKDDMSVRSQPTMSRSHRHGHRREGGYASDLEAYAGRGRGFGRSSRQTAATPSPKPRTSMSSYPTNSVPQDLNTQTPDSSNAQPYPATPVRPQSCVTVPRSHPRSGSSQRPACPPSPSQFSSESMLDQSTPVTTQAPHGFPNASSSQPGACVYSQAGATPKEQNLQVELSTVLEERNRMTAAQDMRPSPVPSSLKNQPVRQTPPPYQPAPPYRRSSDRTSVQSDSCSGQDSPRDSVKGGSAFSNPEYTAMQYNNKGRDHTTNDLQVDYAKEYETLASARNTKDSQYPSSAGEHYRTPPYNQGFVEGAHSSPYQGYGEGTRTSGDSLYGDHTNSLYGDHTLRDGSRLFRQDYSSVSPYGETGRGSNLQHPSHSTYLARTPMVPHPDRSRENLTPVSAHYSHLDNSARHSPHQFSTSTPAQPRSGLRDNILEGTLNTLTPQKTFEAYPNPYGEPLEVGDPLMSRYEDVALFKSMQNPSQVSSSTDSGYGHGHQIYERIGDFNARQSGSPYSATPPPHRDTPVRHNSSSQGTPSRETTPVREEAMYPLQTSVFSDSSSQESRDVFRTVIHKNPGLGFSIAGGQGSQGQNPFRYGDSGIFVTKIQPDGPAASVIKPGDKILQVNHVDFGNIDHSTAVNVLKTSSTVELLVERVQKVNLV